MKKHTQPYLIAILVSIIFSCSSPENANTNDDNPAQETVESDIENTEEPGMSAESSFKLNLIVANNIASPVKLLTDMNHAGLDHFREDVTNSTDNISNYVTADEKALAFGVYGADLSYIGLYDRNEELIQYLMAIRSLSDDLGLGALFDQESMEQFDLVKTNPDSMKLFIFDKYDQADDFLRSNERLVTATLILTGGLIESLHLVSDQIESGDATRDAYMIFLEQKTTLKNLLELYESLESNGQEISIRADIEMLYKKFEEVDSYEIFAKENIMPLHEAIDQVRSKMI